MTNTVKKSVKNKGNIHAILKWPLIIYNFVLIGHWIKNHLVWENKYLQQKYEKKDVHVDTML